MPESLAAATASLEACAGQLYYSLLGLKTGRIAYM
jgi:hypothetical protein